MRLLVSLKGILDLNWLGMADVDLPTASSHLLTLWAMGRALHVPAAGSWILVPVAV